MNDERKQHQNRIGRYLLKQVVLFSLIITLLFTAVQAWLDFSKRMSAIQETIEQIKHVQIDGIITALWSFDKQGLDAQVVGMLHFPYISYVAVWDSDRVIVETGVKRRNGGIVQEIPLTRDHNGRRILLGTLYLQADSTKVFRDVFSKILVMFLFQAATVAIVACFLFMLFERLVTRHLSLAADYLRGFSVGNINAPLQLDKKQCHDEIDTLVDAFNRMRENLAESYRQQLSAQQRLEESEERYRGIFENALEGIFQASFEGPILSANPTMARILAYDSPDELIACSTDIRQQLSAHPEERDALFSTLLDRGEVLTHELRIYRKDKQTVWVSISARVVRDDAGRPLFLEGFLADITERKLAEEELKRYRDHLEELVEERTAELTVSRDRAEVANQAKSAFLANMSHELRTPLNAILGYAQILKRRSLAPDVIDGLNIVQRSGEHLLTLINDILDLSKIEAGRVGLDHVSIHLSTFLDHVGSIIRSRAEAKHLTFRFETPNHLPCWVDADETRLRQVLLNLLDNAVKFTDAGHVVLRVTFRDATEPARVWQAVPQVLLRFEVEDTGIGIPADQFEHIFLPFEQVRDLGRQTKGTGLGLAISRQLVRAMGGELQVKSELGRGSLFWFEITLPVVKNGGEAGQPTSRIITGYRGPRRKVLVVDDIPSNRAVVVGLLEPLGFEVIEAVDGQQAIHLAREIRPDVILMDRWMPVMDGFEAVQRIRQIPEVHDVLTIAVSASVSKEDEAQSRNAGIDAFLPKPIHWPRLAILLEEHLKLEWEYETADEQVREPMFEEVVSVEHLEPPPEEELEFLLHLAMMGDMRAILEQAVHIETLGERYIPSASKLRELAEGFKEKQILTLVEQWAKKT